MVQQSSYRDKLANAIHSEFRLLHITPRGRPKRGVIEGYGALEHSVPVYPSNVTTLLQLPTILLTGVTIKVHGSSPIWHCHTYGSPVSSFQHGNSKNNGICHLRSPSWPTRRVFVLSNVIFPYSTGIFHHVTLLIPTPTTQFHSTLFFTVCPLLIYGTAPVFFGIFWWFVIPLISNGPDHKIYWFFKKLLTLWLQSTYTAGLQPFSCNKNPYNMIEKNLHVHW